LLDVVNVSLFHDDEEEEEEEEEEDVDFGLMYYLDPSDLRAHGITLDGPNYFM
jgi:hypothetical protein